MKKLLYLTVMAFFFAMSVSFSPPDPVSDPDSYREESISADVEYVADVVAQEVADVAVSFVSVRDLSVSRHSEGGTTEESLSMRLFVPQSDGDIPDRNLIYDVGDRTSEDSNYQSNNEVRSDRRIDPGWCSLR